MNPWQHKKEPPDLLSSLVDFSSASSALSQSCLISHFRPSLVIVSCPLLGCDSQFFSQLVSRPKIVGESLDLTCNVLDLVKPSDLLPFRGAIEFAPFVLSCSLARAVLSPCSFLDHGFSAVSYPTPGCFDLQPMLGAQRTPGWFRLLLPSTTIQERCFQPEVGAGSFCLQPVVQATSAFSRWLGFKVCFVGVPILHFGGPRLVMVGRSCQAWSTCSVSLHCFVLFSSARPGMCYLPLLSLIIILIDYFTALCSTALLCEPWVCWNELLRFTEYWSNLGFNWLVEIEVLVVFRIRFYRLQFRISKLCGLILWKLVPLVYGFVILIVFLIGYSDILNQFTWRLWFVLVYRMSVAGTILRFNGLVDALSSRVSGWLWWKGLCLPTPVRSFRV